MKKNHDGWYLVQSQSDPSTWHDVNPAICVCTCTQGRDGSPCAHQASIVYQYGEESLNFICTMSSRSRFKIASIALGDQAITSTSFYASLHQKAMEEKYGEKSTAPHNPSSTPDFTGTAWDLIRAGAQEDAENPIDPPATPDDMIQKVDQLACDLKNKLTNESDDLQLVSGITKFVERYMKLAASGRSHARLASALHMFGSTAGAVHSTRHGPRLRHGKITPVQATASGRRRKGITRGKAKIPAGRPVGNYQTKGKCAKISRQESLQRGNGHTIYP